MMWIAIHLLSALIALIAMTESKCLATRSLWAVLVIGNIFLMVKR